MYPPLQALDFMSPAYEQKPQTGLQKLEMVGYWLLYAQGHTQNTQYLLQNSHVPPDVFKQYATSTLNHSLLFKRTMVDEADQHKQMQAKEYNDNVWAEIKDIFLNPYFAPLVANDFQGLPKTLVFTGFFDVLCDDGTWYAGALKKANVNVTHYHHETAPHSVFWSRNPRFQSVHKNVVQYIKDNL